MNVVCPSCSNNRTDCLGAIPATDVFAGNVLNRPLPGGSLYRCTSCFLCFRHPRLPKQELDQYYSAGKEDNWKAVPRTRVDWAIAAGYIRSHLSRGTIMDIGCFDGGFLQELGSEYQRYGIEIHEEASRRAQEKGIRIVGSDFEDLEKMSFQLDAVVAIDMIEHVEDPFSFLESLTKAVKPGGLLIISTGNSEAPSWRLLGSRYWYAAVAGHVSFVNPKWCYNVLPRLGLAVERMEFFSHRKASFMKRCMDIGKNVLYRVSPDAAGWLRSKGFGKRDASKHKELEIHPPSWLSARDHFITLFQKR